MPQEPLVNLRIVDGVAWVELSDEKALNAISMSMVEELLQAFDVAETQARAIVLTGVGRAFCAGANLVSGNGAGDVDVDGGAALESHYNPLMRRIRDLSVPIVTAVRGAAAGVGAAIALSGDIIIASDTAYFLQAFRRLGLVPDGGSAFILSRAVGRVRAMELMLLGQKLPAGKALEWGLVTRVVPDEQLATEAMDVARELASGPTYALAKTRAMCWASLELGFDAQLETEIQLQRDATASADAIEGVAAFMAKRPPVFTGRR